MFTPETNKKYKQNHKQLRTNQTKKKNPGKTINEMVMTMTLNEEEFKTDKKRILLKYKSLY